MVCFKPFSFSSIRFSGIKIRTLRVFAISKVKRIQQGILKHDEHSFYHTVKNRYFHHYKLKICFVSFFLSNLQRFFKLPVLKYVFIFILQQLVNECSQQANKKKAKRNFFGQIREKSCQKCNVQLVPKQLMQLQDDDTSEIFDTSNI